MLKPSTSNIGLVGHVVLIPAALAVLACGGNAADVTADELLRRAEAAYAAASTYRDHGVSESILTGPDGEEWTSTVVFSTAFRRPSDFRLTYRSSGRQQAHAILATSSGTQTWVEGAEVPQPFDSIADALRGTIAESQGVSILVVPMLFRDLGRDQPLLNLTDATRLPDAEHENGPAYVIRGDWHDKQITVWLDRRTNLVVRFELADDEIGPDRSGAVKQIVVIEPEVDMEVTSDQFSDRLWDLDG